MARRMWLALWVVAVLPWAEAGEYPQLPLGVTNNAVAAVKSGAGTRLYSFLGLTAGKTWRDVTDEAFEYHPVTEEWKTLPPVPGPPRLASTAEVVAGQVYLFGGYTVAEDHSEVSRPEVFRFDPEARRFESLAPMPVPVDDTVSGVHLDRYVYLVSGWHDQDNVDNVQVYDTVSDHWQQATPYPGPPVFGHAGGILDGHIVICDGVEVVPVDDGRREFKMSPACFRGAIDPTDLTSIDWREMAQHPGPALYRSAAVATRRTGPRILFAGGSDNPYNYDGIGYDGNPSRPTDRVFSFSLLDDRWETHPPLPVAGMDHRGLLEADGRFVIIGGLDAERSVTARVVVYRLEQR